MESFKVGARIRWGLWQGFVVDPADPDYADAVKDAQAGSDRHLPGAFLALVRISGNEAEAGNAPWLLAWLVPGQDDVKEI